MGTGRFFPTGWVDRSIAAVKRPATRAKVERWWGRSDWADLLGMDRTARARLVATRFEQELGYGKAEVFPIHSAKHGTVRISVCETLYPDSAGTRNRHLRISSAATLVIA